jgi:hypothetical protein
MWYGSPRRTRVREYFRGEESVILESTTTTTPTSQMTLTVSKTCRSLWVEKNPGSMRSATPSCGHPPRGIAEHGLGWAVGRTDVGKHARDVFVRTGEGEGENVEGGPRSARRGETKSRLVRVGREKREGNMPVFVSGVTRQCVWE